MFGKYDARYSIEGLAIYEEVIKQAKSEFEAKVGSLTVFHKMLIDRVADAYVKVAAENEIKAFSDNKTGQEVLQKWLNMALSELHSATSELGARRIFFDRTVDILDKHVLDEMLRKSILTEMRDAVKEGG